MWNSMIERCKIPNIHSNRNTSWSSPYSRYFVNSAIQHFAKHKLDAAATHLPCLSEKTVNREQQSQCCSSCLVPGRLGPNGIAPFVQTRGSTYLRFRPAAPAVDPEQFS